MVSTKGVLTDAVERIEYLKYGELAQLVRAINNFVQLAKWSTAARC